jgi:hypothetical protein
MSEASMRIAGIIFVVVPFIEFGGMSLLHYLRSNAPGYMENPIRRALFRAGHAHAGVLVILALIGLIMVDYADLSGGMKTLVRNAMALAPILMPAGFFLSIVRPEQTKPNRLIALVYLGALSLAIGTVTLGIGLLRAA